MLTEDLCEVDTHQLALTVDERAELLPRTVGEDLPATALEALLQSYLDGELLAALPVRQREALCLLACQQFSAADELPHAIRFALLAE